MKIGEKSDFNCGLLNGFRESVPGLYLGADADPVFRHGKVWTLSPGQTLASAGPDVLHVLLGGRLSGATEWFGPGNHFTGDAQPLQPDEDGATIWTLDLAGNTWRSTGNREPRKALLRALMAADAAEVAATPADGYVRPDPEDVCDHRHPAIRRQAMRLLRATPASTARAIFYFVQAMPYRFGMWRERASDTLAKGYGMCTTKANLQVALLRAAGLEAGYGAHKIEMAMLGILMPDAWQSQMKRQVFHFFAIVKLDGRWHGTDATYPDSCCDLFAKGTDELKGLFPIEFDEGRPYCPSAMVSGKSGFMDDAMPDLAHVMSKQSRFSQRHFQALNARADLVQGLHTRWLREPAEVQHEVTA